MKINRICFINIGPFEDFDLRLDGKSVALVGANATGKTFLLSSVVDFIYEHLNDFGFMNTLPAYGLGHAYFRLTSTNYLRKQDEKGLIWIDGEVNGKQLYYIEQYGYSNKEEIASLLNIDYNIIPWPRDGEAKTINSLSSSDKNEAKIVCRNTAIFFCQPQDLKTSHGKLITSLDLTRLSKTLTVMTLDIQSKYSTRWKITTLG